MTNNLPTTKLTNNELFAKTLQEYPPLYNVNDLVNTTNGIGYVSGRVFNEKEKKWKYTFKPYGLKNFNMDVNEVLSKLK